MLSNREILNTPRAHQLIADLRAEGVKFTRDGANFTGYLAGEQVFHAAKGSFGFIIRFSDRILIENPAKIAYIAA